MPIATLNVVPDPAPALSRRGLAVLLSGAFAVVFDVFAVNLALPALQRGLGADLAASSLVIAVYALAFGSCLVLGARLGDRIGRRRLFSAGMAGFAVTSLACALAPTPWFLIAARLLQGLSAALLFPQIYTSLQLLHDADRRARAFSALGMSIGLAAIAGQILGGGMVWLDLYGLGWRLVFLVNLPWGLAVALLARAVPESYGPASGLDLPGAVLVSASLGALLVALLEGAAHAWPTWSVLCLAAAAGGLGLFIAWERHAARRGRTPPILDPALLAEPRFACAAAAVLLVYATPGALFLAFSLALQQGAGRTPLAAGALLTPMSVGFVLASLAAPKLMALAGRKGLIAAPAAYGLGFLWLAGLAAGSGLGALALTHPAFMLGMLAFGAAQALSGPPLLNHALGAVEQPARAGMASGVISTAQQLGMALGVALGSLLFAGGLAAAPAAAAQAERCARGLVYALSGNALLMFAGAALVAASLWLRRDAPR